MALRPTTSKARAWLVSRGQVAIAARAGHCVRIARGPGQRHVPAQRPADHGQQPLDAQVVDQPPLHLDDVADGDQREIGAVGAAGGRVDAVGPGRAAAAAQDVRADDEVAVGVDRLARARPRCPTSRDRRRSSCRATCESPERAWQISTALSRAGLSVP